MSELIYLATVVEDEAECLTPEELIMAVAIAGHKQACAYQNLVRHERLDHSVETTIRVMSGQHEVLNLDATLTDGQMILILRAAPGQGPLMLALLEQVRRRRSVPLDGADLAQAMV